MSRAVVITGIGPITACGVGIEPLWAAMIEGRSAIASNQRFLEAGLPCPFSAQLPPDAFDVRKVVPKSYRKATKVMCRDVELAVGAAAAAIADAGLVTKGVDADAAPTIPPHRLGCQIGAGLIAADVEELTAALAQSRRPVPGHEGEYHFDLAHWGDTGMASLTPLWLLKYLPNMLACHVTIIHDCQGPSNTITCCEASSGLSLGESMRVIERGDADACLTGGTEHKLNPFAFLRQYFAERLADPLPDDDPTAITRPFDPTARGSVIGEGGGLLVVEALECARARGASIYAEVAGFAATQSHCLDAAGLRPDPGDQSIADAIELALAAAGMTAEQIDAVLPFGSSIPHVDAAEAAAIRQVFGARAASVPVITTTPFVGNCNAGNGAIGLAVAAQAIRAQRLPARLNTSNAVGIDANAAQSREARLNAIVVFSTSQGGQNAALVLRKAA